MSQSYLPYPPYIKLAVLDEQTIPEDGFLRVRRTNVKAYYPDGKESVPFTIDAILRTKMDAVAIIAHFVDEAGERYLYLRSCIRPSIQLMDYSKSKLPEEQEVGNLWELPAGLVELNEIGTDGLKSAAARELEEEVGFSVDPKNFNFLGKRIFPVGGIAGERIFFLETEVDPSLQKEPSLDGHPLEDGGRVIAVPLKEAVKYVYKGYLPDGKTEIGILRLAYKFGVAV